MQQNEFESKMNKQIGVSLKAVDWFVLCTFLKSIFVDEESVKKVFASAEDCQAIEAITKRISGQFGLNLDKALEKEDEAQSLENILKLPPKKLILPKGGDIIT